MERIPQYEQAMFNSEEISVFSLFIIYFVPWGKGVQTYTDRSDLWLMPYRVYTKIPNHTIVAPENTHTAVWSPINSTVCITDTKSHLHACFVRAIKNKGKVHLYFTQVKNAPPVPEVKTVANMHHRCH